MTTALRPGMAFALAHPAHFIALGFGAGTVRVAPGTVGTLIAYPLWWQFAHGYGTGWQLALVALFFAFGVKVCDVTGRHLGVADHGAMVWDEVVAFLLVLIVLPAQLSWQIAGFVLFRFFDVVKPEPVRSIERRFKGGFGVMIDDIVAALLTLLVLAIFKRLFLQ